MVFSGDGGQEYMATRHERSNALHNFTLPNLKWGSQRHLRCMKVDSTSTANPASGSGSGDGDQRLRHRSSPSKINISFRFGGADQRSNNHNVRLSALPSTLVENGIKGGIEEFREKIMSDLRTEVDKMTESIFRKKPQANEDEEQQTNGSVEGKEKQKEELWAKEKENHTEREVSPPAAPAPVVEVRPWNLRKRRATCKAPISGSGNCNGNQYNSPKQICKVLGMEERRVNLCHSGNESAQETKARPKFSSSLSRKEIENDFMTMLGHRPPRRPKKRPRTVQKQLDILYPGSCLSEVTLDTYKISDAPENRKKR